MDAGHVLQAFGNLTTAGALAAAGSFALALAIAPPPRSLFAPRLWFGAGCGLVTLAADEGLELHDRIGRWLWHEHGVAAPGPINHVDDLFVIAYVAGGTVVLIALLPALRRRPGFLAAAVGAGVLFAAGTAVDALAARTSATMIIEEGTEAAGAALLAAALAGEWARARYGAREVRARTIDRSHAHGGAVRGAPMR